MHLDSSVHGVNQFPLALLVALRCLKAGGNEFAELPAGITALSKLTELSLGRTIDDWDPLQLLERRPLDVCALGDLSGFPALCELSFSCCEAKMCPSMLGAVRHASLGSISFRSAHPASECALMVLRLSQALKELRRGSVLKFVNDGTCSTIDSALRAAQGRAPFQKFVAALVVCGL